MDKQRSLNIHRGQNKRGGGGGGLLFFIYEFGV